MSSEIEKEILGFDPETGERAMGDMLQKGQILDEAIQKEMIDCFLLYETQEAQINKDYRRRTVPEHFLSISSPPSGDYVTRIYYGVKPNPQEVLASRVVTQSLAYFRRASRFGGFLPESIYRYNEDSSVTILGFGKKLDQPYLQTHLGDDRDLYVGYSAGGKGSFVSFRKGDEVRPCFEESRIAYVLKEFKLSADGLLQKIGPDEYLVKLDRQSQLFSLERRRDGVVRDRIIFPYHVEPDKIVESLFSHEHFTDPWNVDSLLDVSWRFCSPTQLLGVNWEGTK